MLCHRNEMRRLRRFPEDSNRDNLYNQKIYDSHHASERCASRKRLHERVIDTLSNNRVKMVLFIILFLLVAYYFLMPKRQIISLGGFVDPVEFHPFNLPSVLQN